jgi:glycosyltransferase involved in cell wall biosynthesis
MRVLILAESFYPLGGGVGTYGLALSRELVKRGIAVTVVTRRQRPDLPSQETIDGVEIIRLAPSGFPRAGKYLTLAPVLLHLLKHRGHFDLVYVWGLRILGVAAAIAGRFLRKPIVLRAEQTGEIPGSFIWQDRQRTPGIRDKVMGSGLKLRDGLLQRADRLVAISSEIAQEFEAAGYDRDRMIRIPNGVDLQRFQPVTRETAYAIRDGLGLPRKSFLFVYSGRLHRHKGLSTLLDAWRHLVTADKSGHLVLVGENSPNLGVEAELREFVSHHLLGDTVTFTGRQSDVLPWLQAADAFILPSQREGLSISLLEAMATGLPAIGTRTSGTTELIRPGENGYLVDIGDAAAMTRAMASLLRNPREAQEMGRKSRKLVEQDFGLEAAAERHLALFSSLVSTRREAAPEVTPAIAQA